MLTTTSGQRTNHRSPRGHCCHCPRARVSCGCFCGWEALARRGNHRRILSEPDPSLITVEILSSIARLSSAVVCCLVFLGFCCLSIVVSSLWRRRHAATRTAIVGITTLSRATIHASFASRNHTDDIDTENNARNTPKTYEQQQHQQQHESTIIHSLPVWSDTAVNEAPAFQLGRAPGARSRRFDARRNELDCTTRSDI